MLKKPFCYLVVFSVMHSSVAQVAYGMDPDALGNHVPRVHQQVPAVSSELEAKTIASQAIVEKITGQTELPVSQPQAIVKQSNDIAANNQSPPEIQSQSGSPKNLTGALTPDKDSSSSAASTPEKSPRGGGDTKEEGENGPNVTALINPDLNVPVQQQLVQVQVHKQNIMDQTLQTNTTTGTSHPKNSDMPIPVLPAQQPPTTQALQLGSEQKVPATLMNGVDVVKPGNLISGLQSMDKTQLIEINASQSPSESHSLTDSKGSSSDGSTPEKLSKSESSDSIGSTSHSPRLEGAKEGEAQSIISADLIKILTENASKSSTAESNTGQVKTQLLDQNPNKTKDYNKIIKENGDSKDIQKTKKDRDFCSPQSKNPTEQTPLVSRGSVDEEESLLNPSKDRQNSSKKQSLSSRGWDILAGAGNFVAGLLKRKNVEKELPSNSVTDSSSPLLMSNDAQEDTDSSEGADESVEGNPATSGVSENDQKYSINQPPNHGSSKELDRYDSAEKSWVIVDLYKNVNVGKKEKSKRPPIDGEGGDDPDNGKDLTLISIDDPELPPAVRAFLLHVKDRVIDGKLNGKQIAGIVGGVALGATVATPLIAIFIDGAFELNGKLNNQLHGDTPLSDSIMGIVGPTLGLDAASRTATILVHYGEPKTNSFSIKKDKTHRCALILTRSGIYIGALVAGSLPLFYLYSYSYLCDEGDKNCNPSAPISQVRKDFFAGFGPFLVLDTTLQYGYQLSQQAERAINKRFYKIRNLFSPTEQKRQSYLDYLKNLKRIIYYSDGDILYDLYEDIFVNKAETRVDKKIDPKDLKIEETLHILRLFNTFYQRATKPTEIKEEEAEKQVGSSAFGWVATTAATVGRTVIFSHIVEAMLHAVGVYGPWNQAITVIFGGLVGNLIQGKIEKDAAKQVAYDLAQGKKIPNGSSHRPLRIGIKTWDYAYGAFNTLPYMLVGIDATHTWGLGWQVATLVPFGLADTFNNATAFHDSNLAVVNAVDSTISYCYPFEGYKRDKLIRMTRQLRELFKNLNPQVLETVDQKLTTAYD